MFALVGRWCWVGGPIYGGFDRSQMIFLLFKVGLSISMWAPFMRERYLQSARRLLVANFLPAPINALLTPDWGLLLTGPKVSSSQLSFCSQTFPKVNEVQVGDAPNLSFGQHCHKQPEIGDAKINNSKVLSLSLWNPWSSQGLYKWGFHKPFQKPFTRARVFTTLPIKGFS